MSHPTRHQSEPPASWGTRRRWLSGVALLLVALLHVPIVGIAADSGFSVSSGGFKIFTYWAIAVLLLDFLMAIAWATLEGDRPLLAALPIVSLVATILAGPLVIVLPI